MRIVRISLLYSFSPYYVETLQRMELFVCVHAVLWLLAVRVNDGWKDSSLPQEGERGVLSLVVNQYKNEGRQEIVWGFSRDPFLSSMKQNEEICEKTGNHVHRLMSRISSSLFI